MEEETVGEQNWSPNFKRWTDRQMSIFRNEDKNENFPVVICFLPLLIVNLLPFLPNAGGPGPFTCTWLKFDYKILSLHFGIMGNLWTEEKIPDAIILEGQNFVSCIERVLLGIFFKGEVIYAPA